MSEDAQRILFALLTFVTAAVFSFAASPLIKQFAHTVGAIDVPQDERRMHKTPIPRLGGLAIFLGFLLSLLLFVQPIPNDLRGILLGSVVIMVIGVIDDIVRLRAWVKLLAQIVAAVIPILHGVVLTRLANPFAFNGSGFLDFGVFSIPITIVWIVAIVNAVNFIDGLDGLAAGVSSISSVSLMIIAILLQMPVWAVVMAALAGACVGFLPYNRNPAKMFMGDTGATFIGFILATVSLQGLFKSYTLISFAIPFLILALPIFDILFSVTRRIASGHSPTSADAEHIHHKLIDMGLSQKQSVAILYTLSAVLGLSAVVLATSGEIKTMIFLIAVIVALLIGYKVLSPAKNHTASAPPEDQPIAPSSADKEDPQ